MQKARIGNETLYNGISRIWGGWMLTTEGDPITVNDLEEAVANNPAVEEEVKQLYKEIGDPHLEWEKCDEEDVTYIEGWLETWGI